MLGCLPFACDVACPPPQPAAAYDTEPVRSNSRVTVSFATLGGGAQGRYHARRVLDTSPIRGTRRPHSAMVRRRSRSSGALGQGGASARRARPQSAAPRRSALPRRGLVSVPSTTMRESRSHVETRRAMLGSALDSLEDDGTGQGGGGEDSEEARARARERRLAKQAAMSYEQQQLLHLATMRPPRATRTNSFRKLPGTGGVRRRRSSSNSSGPATNSGGACVCRLFVVCV